MKTKYVIIGNSAAAIGAIEGIRQADKIGEITVISNEPHHTYSRPLISYLLLGKTDEEKMKYRGDDFYETNGCTLIYNEVTSIDSKTNSVFLANDSHIPYDKLLVATGSSAFVPPFEGLNTVTDKFTFMCLDDAKKLSTALDKNKRVLIVGAGLIGLKCAEGISERSVKITVLDLASQILSSILDEDGARIVQTHLEKHKIEFKLSASIKRFEGDVAVLGCGSAAAGGGSAAVLDSGERIEFDVLVLAVGVRPNTALLQGIADIERGIIVDGKSQTSAPDIYAAGDCTQTMDISSGQSKIMALLPNAYMQGECAGINMASGSGCFSDSGTADDDGTTGNGTTGGSKSFDKAIPMNAIGFFGLHIITAGHYNGEVYSETNKAFTETNESFPEANEPFSEVQKARYKRLFYSGNKLNGYILIGDVAKAGIYTSLIRERTSLDTVDFALICQRPGLMAFTKEERASKLGEAK